ncbi:MAG: hypothetical protein LBR18_09295 [Tannerella sp.]|jgi:hypothetical protein|nr:hypothetical protein [Tannerella sp.]
MKKAVFLLIAITLICTSIYYDINIYRGEYTPVFMERSELERSVFYVAQGRELENTGKIYYKAPYIFVNERYKGVHVIDNTIPADPRNIGFIVAPGCIDIAVKGNVMYIDNAVDLVAFDLDSKQVTHREKNVFPEPIAPNGDYYSSRYDRPSNDAVLVGWKKSDY